ncbi:MAG: EcsC family protein [Oscillospiraceae bacterium]|nr:EcsC family protein [Oscillospiraceae bacterium]
MSTKTYIIPEQIVDAKEEKALIALTESYNKMVAPGVFSKAVDKVGEMIPQGVKDMVAATGKKISETELFLKSMEYLTKSFQTLEQFAAKVTVSKAEIIKQINRISPDNEITSLDEICLVRSYDLSQVVGKYKFADIIAALAEGAATGAPGFAGLPFNLVLSTFLFYRAVQSIALFYGYDIKNDPAELQIASEVFMSALNPKSKGETELSGVIAKVMLLTSTTTVKQTVKKGWTAMAQKGGVPLLLAQMRALANSAAKKALEKAGKKGLEKTAFTEVFEQIGKKLTQKSVGKAIPYIGAFIGATIDAAQMVQITQFAETFYCKRFILEKESRIYTLTGDETASITVNEIPVEQISEQHKEP